MLPPLLRGREFRRYWSGQAISLFGDQITLLALPLVAVLVLHAGAAEMGYLAAAGLLPNLIFAVHAGAWVDRHGNRRRVMIAADIGRAGLLATIPLAAALGMLTLTQLYVVAFLTGTLSVLFVVSQATVFVSVIPAGRYVEANALIYGGRALSFMGGPSVAGLLVQLLSAPLALLADATSFLASALFLGRISPVEPPIETRRRGSITAGARWIRHSPIVLATLASAATINLFNFVFSALFVLYATRNLHINAGTLGAVLGIGAAGSMLGSIVTARITRRIGVGPAYLLGCILFPAPLVLVPLAGGTERLVLALLFAAEFAAGFGVMVLDISIGSLFAAIIPDHLRSRVAGAFQTVNYGVRPLGSLLGGALGSSIGLRAALWIGTVGAIAGVLWLLPSPIPRLRTLPARPADPAAAGEPPAVDEASAAG
jgi:MFS family permease